MAYSLYWVDHVYMLANCARKPKVFVKRLGMEKRSKYWLPPLPLLSCNLWISSDLKPWQEKKLVKCMSFHHYSLVYVTQNRSAKVKHELRVTSSNPRVTSSNPRVASSNSRVTSSDPWVMDSALRVRTLKALIATLKARVGGLKARVGRLKARVRRLKARTETIKPRVRW